MAPYKLLPIACRSANTGKHIIAKLLVTLMYRLSAQCHNVFDETLDQNHTLAQLVL